MAKSEPKMKLRDEPLELSEQEAATEAANAIAIIKALKDPNRRRLIICLSVTDTGVNSPSTLHDYLYEDREKLGTTSYHMRELLRLGMVEEFGVTPRRGAVEHHYRLTPLGREAFKRIEGESPTEVAAILIPDDES